MMLELGFPEEFTSWVMSCVRIVSYSVMINGVPSEPFPAQKGLRQGDPMSPFLFAIGMEHLSRCLGELKHDANFNFHLRCEKLAITHMMFADDLIMFSRADPISVQLLYQAFMKFFLASSLAANISKSLVYFWRLSDLLQHLSKLFCQSQRMCFLSRIWGPFDF